MKDLELEAIKFPKGKTVDILDAVSFHLHIKPTTSPEKPADKEPAPGSLLDRIREIGKINKNKAMESYF